MTVPFIGGIDELSVSILDGLYAAGAHGRDRAITSKEMCKQAGVSPALAIIRRRALPERGLAIVVADPDRPGDTLWTLTEEAWKAGPDGWRG